MAHHWEYKTIEVKPKFLGKGFRQEIDKELNDLGRQGWELVGAGHHQNSFGWLFFLKRRT